MVDCGTIAATQAAYMLLTGVAPKEEAMHEWAGARVYIQGASDTGNGAPVGLDAFVRYLGSEDPDKRRACGSRLALQFF